MNIPMKYEDVVAKLDAALGREAALREELARYKSLFGQAQKAIDRLNELHPKRMGELAKRLTVAEQRAVDMVYALARIQGRAEMFIDDGMHMPTPSIEAIRDIAAKAALKPAAEGVAQ